MDNNKYKYKYSDVPKRIEEGVPPLYSDVPGTPASRTALPVAGPNVLVNPAPPSGCVIPGQPGGTPPVVVQPKVIYLQAPVIQEYEAPDHLGMAVFSRVHATL